MTEKEVEIEESGPEYKEEYLDKLTKEELIKELIETRKWRDQYHDSYVFMHNKLVDIRNILDKGDEIIQDAIECEEEMVPIEKQDELFKNREE